MKIAQVSKNTYDNQLQQSIYILVIREICLKYGI